MSQKSVKFSRDTNEINQSNAKTDAPKTVNCLKWKSLKISSPANWFSKTVVRYVALPPAQKHFAPLRKIVKPV